MLWRCPSRKLGWDLQSNATTLCCGADCKCLSSFWFLSSEFSQISENTFSCMKNIIYLPIIKKADEIMIKSVWFIHYKHSLSLFCFVKYHANSWIRTSITKSHVSFILAWDVDYTFFTTIYRNKQASFITRK